MPEEPAAALRGFAELRQSLAWSCVLLPAKQSLLMSALINTLHSKCTLDAELSVGLSLMTHRVTSWHLSLEESR